MRVLITGATGFVGTHLAEYLSGKNNLELFGLHRAHSKKKCPSNVRLFACNIRDAKRVPALLKKIKPERIFHLAAFASAAQSWKYPAKTFEDNVTGTRVLLDAIARQCPKARVHVASSAEVYGFCRGQRERVTENTPFQPMNPYAVSKIAQEALAQQYGLSHHLHIVRTRAFNHIGPRQSDTYVTGNFARQVSAIEAGKSNPVIRVGNLRAIRDFTDVRDVVRAYWLCLERGTPGDVYNVCSGTGTRVTDILDYYLRHSTVKIAVRKSADRYRRIDAAALVGDPRKLKKATGWKAAFSLSQSLQDILCAWRKEYGVFHA